MAKEKAPTSWKPELQIASDSKKWRDNTMRFATEREAFDNARDAMQRWFAVLDSRATPSDDAVTHTYLNNKLVAVVAGATAKG